MATPTEFFRWGIIDERTGKRRRTTYELTRENVARQFAGGEPHVQSREIRLLRMDYTATPGPSESR